MHHATVGAAPSGRPARPGRKIHVVAWEDRSLDAVGFDVRSSYVETFWLPFLGPSATWLLRRLVDHLEAEPTGFTLDVETWSRSLGLGASEGKHAPFHRAVRRSVRFGFVRQPNPELLAVRPMVGRLPERFASRLPGDLRQLHLGWPRSADSADVVRRRARLLALDLTGLGEPPAAVELRLTSWGVHPALAYETALWVTSLTGAAPPPR
ncbi:MAG TPA: hypothetical protein VK277_00295 [Acidimicrobiales bacterium]|nr:hypothetical protein [Acidimicrobiales bacterium]